MPKLMATRWRSIFINMSSKGFMLLHELGHQTGVFGETLRGSRTATDSLVGCWQHRFMTNARLIDPTKLLAK